ncbi:MAG: GNAT family N-acetyltransferase [Oscillospiraceae bacterium]|nr:GNAT family N-acetyltransferase [Oscillospiraceae bacterium]
MNIEIRQLKPEDLPYILKWADGRGGDYTAGDLPAGPEQAKAWLASLAGRADRRDCMVELYGTAIGLIGLTEIGAASARLYLRIGEVGYNSVRSAAYAALPMLRYAFYRLGLQTVQLDAAAGNAEAAAVFSKMGFLARGGPGAETAELTLTRADFARHEFLF